MNYIDRKCHSWDIFVISLQKLYLHLQEIDSKLVQNHIKYEYYVGRIFKCADSDYKSTRKIQLCKHARSVCSRTTMMFGM